METLMKNEVENWFCRDRESFYSGTNGWSYGSSIPYFLQGAGGRSVVHRDGQCKGDFFS